MTKAQQFATNMEMCLLASIDLRLAVEDLTDWLENKRMKTDVASAIAAHRAVEKART